jgi:hypothetical protein
MATCTAKAAITTEFLMRAPVQPPRLPVRTWIMGS